MTNPHLTHVRPSILQITPYKPGKPIEALARETGLADIIKLASNESALGPSPRAMAAAQEALLQVVRYPEERDLKAALAEFHGIDPQQITLGHGSSELFVHLATLLLGPQRNAVYSQYAFEIYPIVVKAAGALGREVPAMGPHAAMPFGHDLAAMLEAVDRDTAIVFVANPNNPTGTHLEYDELAGFLERMPQHVMVVLDEAYVEYLGDRYAQATLQLLQHFPNVVLTRTFSKIHGLAGLRVGYAMSSAAVADLLNRVRLPFNVGRPSLAAAAASLQDTAHLEQAFAINEEGRRYLVASLQEMGLAVLPAAANFVTVALHNAQAIYEALLAQGIIVRPLKSYGLPDYLRITIGLPRENQRFVAALRQLLARGAHL